LTILDERLGSASKRVGRRSDTGSFTEQQLIVRGRGYQVPKFDQVPSGDLILLITNVHGLRERWRAT